MGRLESTKSKGNRDPKRMLNGVSPTQTGAIAAEMTILVSRVLAAFGILHVVTEYGVDMTRCEGPSMMPTIKSLGEIIVIEKITRNFGIEGGNDGEIRAKNAQAKQNYGRRRNIRNFCLVAGRMMYTPQLGMNRNFRKLIKKTMLDCLPSRR